MCFTHSLPHDSPQPWGNALATPMLKLQSPSIAGDTNSVTTKAKQWDRRARFSLKHSVMTHMTQTSSEIRVSGTELPTPVKMPEFYPKDSKGAENEACLNHIWILGRSWL